MGRGLEEARQLAPEHAALIDDAKDQLLIALVRRLGGDVVMPASELDATGGFVLLLEATEHGNLHFTARRKQ